MRIIHFDIDTLRADHLGCYGYERPTSPVMDAVAADGVRFDNVYTSDLPCLPSRTALSSGRFGIHNGVAGHGGTAASPFPEGSDRGFRSRDAAETWWSRMQDVGIWTASISTFPERHSAYHFLAGFNESYNLGTRGLETADQVAEASREWMDRNSSRQDWFLHVHMSQGIPTRRTGHPTPLATRSLACPRPVGSTRTCGNVAGAFPDHILRRRSPASVPTHVGAPPSHASLWLPTT